MLDPAPDPKPGRGVALGIVAGTAALVAGVLVASTTLGSIDPLYRFGREPREPRVVRIDPARADADPFIPIRWSGFAAAPPPRKDPYDDPALLAEPHPRRAKPPPKVKLPRSEPVIIRPPAPDVPVAEPLDLPPPITPAEIGEAPPPLQ